MAHPYPLWLSKLTSWRAGGLSVHTRQKVSGPFEYVLRDIA